MGQAFKVARGINRVLWDFKQERTIIFGRGRNTRAHERINNPNSESRMVAHQGSLVAALAGEMWTHTRPVAVMWKESHGNTVEATVLATGAQAGQACMRVYMRAHIKKGTDLTEKLLGGGGGGEGGNHQGWEV